MLKRIVLSVCAAFAAVCAAGAAGAGTYGYWPFTDGFADESGNGHALTNGSSATASDGAAHFLEVTDNSSWARTTNQIPLSGCTSITPVFWLRCDPDKQPAGTRYLLDLVKGSSHAKQGDVRFSVASDGAIHMLYRVTDRAPTYSKEKKSRAGVLADGEWHCVAARLGSGNSPTTELYVDGALDSTSVLDPSGRNFTAFQDMYMHVARRADAGATEASFGGDMDEIRIDSPSLADAAAVRDDFMRTISKVYGDDEAKYQSRLPDGYRSLGGKILYRVRVVSDRDVAFGDGEAKSGTNDYWFTEGTAFTLTAAAAANGERIHWTGVPLTASFDAAGEAASFVATAPAEITVDTFTPTHVWTGVVSTDFAADENWADALGGETNAPSGPSASVFIPETAANQPIAKKKISVGDFRIGSLTNGAQTATFTAQMTTTNEVAGSCRVFSNGSLTHMEGGSSMLRMTVAGDMTVCAGGSVNVSYKGKNATGGKNVGGSYGGGGNARSGDGCFGSILDPKDIGGTGNYERYSGGVVYLDVTGVLCVDGSVEARGTSSSSGGSILLKAAKLTGGASALISVKCDGGTMSGGGGRLAVYERTATDWAGYKGKFLANGGSGSYNGGAGSIYKETAADNGHGELIYENVNQTATISSITTGVGGHDHLYGHITIKGNASVQLRSGVVLRTIRGISVTGGTLTSTDNTSGVEVVPEENGTAKFDGNMTLGKFICTGPGATLEFAAGSVVTNIDNGTFELHGTTENPLVVKSSAEGGTFYLDVGASPKMAVDHVTVSDCAARGTAIANVGGTGIGENPGWTFPPDVIVGQDIVWTGAGDGAWANAANWDLERTPLGTDHVVIPGGRERYPTMIDPFVANSLSISNGASVTLSAGADLSVSNALYDAGTIAASGKNEELRLIGGGEQAVDFCGRTVSRLVIAKTGGGVSFADGFEVTSLVCRTEAPLTLAFAPGKTVRVVDNFCLDGLEIGETEDAHLLTLRSAVEAEAWMLDLRGVHSVRGVSASDCTATGRPVKAGALSTGAAARNAGWDFGENAAVEWVGGDSSKPTDWATAANWHPAVVPGALTHVRIAKDGASVAVAKGTAFLSAHALALGGREGTVSFTANAPLALGDSLAVLNGATAVLNTFNALASVATNDLFVAEGGVLTHGQSNDESKKLDLRLLGRGTVEYAGSIHATGKGPASSRGPGKGGRNEGGSHGGAGKGRGADTCYGSIFCPTNCGSGSEVSTAAGGAVRLVASGDLAVYGSVLANGSSGSGGSVWLTAARISGTGAVRADGDSTSAAYSHGGGRVALYQTAAADFTGLSGLSVTANGGGGAGAGTIYRQHARQPERGGEIVKNGSGVTPLPLVGARNVDGLRAFRTVTLVLKADGMSLAGDLTLNDLDIPSDSATIKLDGHILKLKSALHKNGRGWARDYAHAVVEEDKEGNRGTIVWPQGMLLMIR